MKRCGKCNVKKPLDEFYREARSKDGRQRWCKKCASEYSKSEKAKESQRRHRETESYRMSQRRYDQSEKGKTTKRQWSRSEKAKEYRRKWDKTDKAKAIYKRYRESDKGKATQQRDREHYPERHAARHKVNFAVECGELLCAKDQDCAICGREAQSYHHHKGYAREYWLDVIPLCNVCHGN